MRFYFFAYYIYLYVYIYIRNLIELIYIYIYIGHNITINTNVYPCLNGHWCFYLYVHICASMFCKFKSLTRLEAENDRSKHQLQYAKTRSRSHKDIYPNIHKRKGGKRKSGIKANSITSQQRLTIIDRSEARIKLN
jgi:hypothetical protein